MLYVTGDFYDINFVSQTNVMLNSDLVAQAVSTNAFAPTGQAIASSETANTGSNGLINLARIAVVGTTSDAQFVGGHAYSDAILVQANLVDESSHVAIGASPALAAELATFTGVEIWAVSHGDVSHQQDLFHGVMG